MYRFFLSYCFSFLLFAMHAPAQQDLPSSVEKLAKKYVKKRKNQGLLIGVLQNGQTRFFGFGQLSKGNEQVPDEQTLFQIGTLTTVFTTSLMYYESMQGRFELGDPVQFYTPQSVEVPGYVPIKCVELPVPNLPPDMAVGQPPRIISCKPDPQEADICVAFCDLASHTAGLPNAPGDWYDWNPFSRNHSNNLQNLPDTADFWRVVPTVVPSEAPGRYFKFSNYGIALLGNLLATMHDQEFETYLQEQMLQSLRLSHTGFAPAPDLPQATGHDLRGEALAPSSFQAFAPVAGLWSNGIDLLKWLNQNMTSVDFDWSNAFDQVQQARFDVPFRINGAATDGGFGWFVSKLSEDSNLPVTWINGGTAGFRSFLAFNRDTQTGVVILSNSAQMVDEIGWLLLQEIVE